MNYAGDVTVPIATSEIEGVIEWIRSGAEWAEATAPMTIQRRVVTAEERAFWSFRALDATLGIPGGSDAKICRRTF